MVSVVSLDQFKEGDKSLSVRVIAGENRVWWCQQGENEIRALGTARKAGAAAKNRFLAVQSAMWDGFKLEIFKLQGGKYGQIRVLVRDGQVLTRGGFESYSR